MDVVSTPTKNIAKNGYFRKIRVLIRKKHVNLAGFGWPVFFTPCFIQDTGRKCNRMPAIARKRDHAGAGRVRPSLHSIDKLPDLNVWVNAWAVQGFYPSGFVVRGQDNLEKKKYDKSRNGNRKRLLFLLISDPGKIFL